MLRIQLGHPPRERCSNPQPGHSDFVVLHDNGIHRVHVDFCGCDRGEREEAYIQLLREGWYPATHERPQTAATFQVLDRFHLQTLQAKTTAYDFYTVLERLTGNTGVKPPDRYQPFLRMSRQWRHLMMLKRAGRGHDPSGVLGTGAGELAVECLVCPNPKVNLPEGWENAAPADQCVSYPLPPAFVYKYPQIPLYLFSRAGRVLPTKAQDDLERVQGSGLGDGMGICDGERPISPLSTDCDRPEGGKESSQQFGAWLNFSVDEHM